MRQGDERILEVSSLAAINRIYGELLRLAEPDEAEPDLWVVKPLPPLRELASQAATTRELGLRVDLEASEHTVESLVDALTGHFAGGELSRQ